MASRRSSGTRLALQRGSRFVVVTSLFFAQLVATMHLGLVHHEFCTEHDELVETTVDAPHADIAKAGIHSTTVKSEGHDHCVASAMGRSLSAHPAPVLVAVAETVTPVPPALTVARVASAPLAVLDVAPKQGPPA